MKKFKLLFLFIFSFGLSIFGQSSLSNDEINHQRYWYLRSELRNRFILQGEGTGRGQPAALLRCQYNYERRTIIMGDATIELGWYWQVLATEYYLLNIHGENTTQTIEELYFSLQAFNRLDAIAELFWVGGNHDANGVLYDPYNTNNNLPDPIWDNANKEWLMNGKNQSTIANEYISDNINQSSSFWMDVKNGNTGVLNGFFVRSDIPYDMKEEFYNMDKRVNTEFIESGTTSAYWDDAYYGLKALRSTEMSKDQLMHILLGLSVIRKFVDPSATYNGQNIRNMVTDIGTRLYKMFRKYDGVLINEHPWFIRNPCNESYPFHILTMFNPTSNDASRCIEFSTGLGAIFDYIIDGDFYHPIPNFLYVNWPTLYNYHQNYISSMMWIPPLSLPPPYPYSSAFQSLWHGMASIQASINSTTVVPIPNIDGACVKNNISQFISFKSFGPQLAFSNCVSWETINIFGFNDFATHFDLCLAAGGNSWHDLTSYDFTTGDLINKTEERLYSFGNSLFQINKPYSNVFKIYYLIHKAIYPSESLNNRWAPYNIEFELNQMKCNGPAPAFNINNTFDYSYMWQSVNRWHADNECDMCKPEDNFEYSGIDYMILYNLYRILYNGNNTDINGNQLGYKNLLDFSISKNYPEPNGFGSQNSPCVYYVFQDLISTSKINSPNPPTHNNYQNDAGNVTFTAGWHIKLTNGFKAEYGTQFRANIDHEICSGSSSDYPNLVIKNIESVVNPNLISPEIANERLEENRLNDIINQREQIQRFKLQIDSITFEASEKNNIIIYPNPVSQNSSFNIDFSMDLIDIVNIDILDINGKVLKVIADEIVCHKGKNLIIAKTTDLSKGIYFVRFICNDDLVMIKLIIQ